ncbi:MAG: FAD-dependent oxidoreductase [Steroidobacteraceae bacterium]|jgi:2-polyprenyl-6-methoxyphenol hydroxylase-like FAD-dependent oxidoreductase
MTGVRKVLIVGGSVAGMSCAIQMRKAGLAVDLIEIDPAWRAYGAGITVTGPTLRALRTLGVLHQVIAAGATWDGAKIHDQAGVLLEEIAFPALALDVPANGGIMRPALHKILSERTLESGTRVRLGTSVARILERGAEVEVEFNDKTGGTYDLVVGADGFSSGMRELILEKKTTPVFTGQVVYRLVAERPPDVDRSHFFMGADCKVGFSPVSATHMYMFLLHRAPDNPWLPPEVQPQRLYEAMAGFGGIVPQIRDTVLTSNAHSVNYRPLEAALQPAPWFRGPMVLIGDAAHATTPHLASGAGMAIEDGIVLTEEIQSKPTVPEALQGFMDRRFERCRLVVENSVKLGQIEMNHGSPQEHTRLMSEALSALRRPI